MSFTVAAPENNEVAGESPVKQVAAAAEAAAAPTGEVDSDPLSTLASAAITAAASKPEVDGAKVRQISLW